MAVHFLFCSDASLVRVNIVFGSLAEASEKTGAKARCGLVRVKGFFCFL